MRLKRTARRLLLQVMPAGAKKRRAHRVAPVMTECLEQLKVEGGFETVVQGRPLLGVALADGPELLGEAPALMERLTFDWLAREKGVTPQHVKILLDVVTRYEFPHMAVGYLEMSRPRSDRRFFHPQHELFASEDRTLDEGLRKELAEVFHPRPGWKVIDIGAYFGHGAVRMAGHVGKEGRVLCVEAKELNVAVIREHIRRNELPQLDVRYNAIWKTAGERIEFHTTDRQANAIDAEVVDGQTVTVETTSIPALMEELGAVPDLVSLTVNGAEVEAIEGLEGMSGAELPKRILAPGWYRKDGEFRWKWLVPSLEGLGYQVAVTKGGMVFGWLAQD